MILSGNKIMQVFHPFKQEISPKLMVWGMINQGLSQFHFVEPKTIVNRSYYVEEILYILVYLHGSVKEKQVQLSTCLMQCSCRMLHLLRCSYNTATVHR